jgi:hypothetical protein
MDSSSSSTIAASETLEEAVALTLLKQSRQKQKATMEKGERPSATKKPKKVPSTLSGTVVPYRVRMNFTEVEDECLTRAYVSVSDDPLKGAQQKGAVFWDNVMMVFQKFCTDNGINHPIPRKREALQDRWRKFIAKDCMRFAGCMKMSKAQRRSGFTEQDYITRARAFYKAAAQCKADETFKFFTCWNILRHECAKFFEEPSEDNTDLMLSHTGAFAKTCDAVKLGKNNEQPWDDDDDRDVETEHESVHLPNNIITEDTDVESVSIPQRNKITNVMGVDNSKIGYGTKKAKAMAKKEARDQAIDKWMKVNINKANAIMESSKDVLNKMADSQAKLVAALDLQRRNMEEESTCRLFYSIPNRRADMELYLNLVLDERLKRRQEEATKHNTLSWSNNDNNDNVLQHTEDENSVVDIDNQDNEAQSSNNDLSSTAVRGNERGNND